jgi:TolB-like protein
MTTDLSRIPNSFVIARSAAFTYNGGLVRRPPQGGIARGVTISRASGVATTTILAC